MELIEATDAVELFCTSWLKISISGLCFYNGTSYFFQYQESTPDVGGSFYRTYHLYSMSTSEIIEIENLHRSVCSLLRTRGGVLEKFSPTYNIVDEYYAHLPNPCGTIWPGDKMVEWIVEKKFRRTDYSKGKTPIIVWRRHG